MDQQRDHHVEGARRGVVGVARGEHAGEPGLLEQHPGGKPHGRHLGLEILLQGDAPCGPERPIRKVRRFDYPLEHLWGKVAQSEPRLDGVDTVVQPPMGLGKPREQNPLGPRSPVQRPPTVSGAPSPAPRGMPGWHSARDGSGRTAPGRAPGRCRATAAPGSPAVARRAGPRRWGPTRVPFVRAIRAPARIPPEPAPPAPRSISRHGTAVHGRDQS